MKKTLKSGKKTVKKIWASRDEDASDVVMDLWAREPKKDHHGFYVFGSHFILSMKSAQAQKIFGKIKNGQCKCFEIREVKE